MSSSRKCLPRPKPFPGRLERFNVRRAGKCPAKIVGLKSPGGACFAVFSILVRLPRVATSELQPISAFCGAPPRREPRTPISISTAQTGGEGSRDLRPWVEFAHRSCAVGTDRYRAWAPSSCRKNCCDGALVAWCSPSARAAICLEPLNAVGCQWFPQRVTTWAGLNADRRRSTAAWPVAAQITRAWADSRAS